ncbi:MAG: ATP-grasp domain-containing protein [Caldilineaceae bacterium]|nr:ATP-grasp domain-containing protein [Caldilineaceae bacterium]HRJ42302.1 ATP-grasp domain-containing protein [Caldilineaceae bacterium]
MTIDLHPPPAPPPAAQPEARRVLLLTTPHSYRTAAFADAARQLGIEALQAVDMPAELADHWNFRLGVDFTQVEQASRQIVEALAERPVQAILSLDDSGAFLAARTSQLLGLPHNAAAAADAARNKYQMRRLLAAAGVLSPRFQRFFSDDDLNGLGPTVETRIGYPCVVKPEDMNGSRGVIRANNRDELLVAARRLLQLIGPGRHFLVEEYIPGVEVALEGILDGGELQVLALFDKPDPLEGPFFEETIYVTPSRLPEAVQADIGVTTGLAARGLGLEMGPIHAELRINERGAWIVEIAGRSIGGLCSRTLRFGTDASLEELILRQATGLPIAGLSRQGQAGGVMMIPIPEAGILRAVHGVDKAKAVSGIEDVQITAQRNYPLVPLPEGDAYLGFIFAAGSSPAEVEAALRAAHAELRFEILPEIRLTVL